MKKCILNFAEGSWYPMGQRRLYQSIKETGWDGEFVWWNSHEDLGCPSHKDIPYAFKTAALMRAFEMGFSLALYVDASIYAAKPFDHVFDHIAEHGYFFEEAGHWTGTWTSDVALAKMGLTRDEAMQIPMLTAGFVGFDLKNDLALDFLAAWHGHSRDGVTFKGPWKNRNGEASSDARCEGHRHDMSVASILAHRMGMDLQKNGEVLAYVGHQYQEPKESACFYLQR